jgi:predicted TPR repeat methyltransferase
MIGILVPSLNSTKMLQDPSMNKPSPRFRSSGDLILDRRYEYAQSLHQRGEFGAAADLLRQTLDLAPEWAPAWFALGENMLKLGHADKAIEAFSQSAKHDPMDEFGAKLKLGSLGIKAASASASRAYIQTLFDQYADRFDSHLHGTLHYRGPLLLKAAIARLELKSFAKVLDLGCGTGLAGEAFRPLAMYLSGVDLSPRMIEIAHRKEIYDHLEIASIVDFLARQPNATANLILAADVLVYFGDLEEMFCLIGQCLAIGGYFAFTLQKFAGSSYAIGTDMRFSHNESYVRETSAKFSLKLHCLEPAATRQEAGVEVPGLIGIVERFQL